MNLLFQIPEHLNSNLVARAAESGKDVESFVIDALCERLEASTECSTSSDFNSWLLEVRTLVPSAATTVDDSRDSIYAGQGEGEYSWIPISWFGFFSRRIRVLPMQYLLFMNSRKAFDPADILAGQLPSSA